jgi:heat shock protein HtpX
MSTSRIRPDRGLTARMTFTMFLLGALYVAVVAGLIAYGVNAGAVIVIALIILFAQYWFSDRLALYAMHGQIVQPTDGPDAARLHAVVDRLCALADMPKPQVAIAPARFPNAFATGRNPNRAVVCATTDILHRLDNEELEGVLAHELSHVAHRDVAVMTIASVLGVIAGLITRLAFYSEMFGGGYGGRGRNNNNDNGALVVLGVMLVSMIVYAISFLLTRALSRYRELSADRSGAILTGHPSALMSALQKVSGPAAMIPNSDLRTAEAFNAFFFTPMLHKSGFSISTLFSTHPSLEVRLRQLARISADLGQPVA